MRYGAWLIVATVLVILGAALIFGSFAALDWDVSGLYTEKYEVNSHSVTETIHNISIDTDTADIRFEVSEDGTCQVICRETENQKHSVTVTEDTLRIRLVDTRKWYEHIGIFGESPAVTVRLPAGAYDSLTIMEHTGQVDLPETFSFRSVDITATTGFVCNRASAAESLRIHTSTGAIRVENISAGAMELSVTTGDITVTDTSCGALDVNVSTGKVTLKGILCESLRSEGDTGDISLTHVVASGLIQINRSTGDVTFDSCDAADLDIRTDTGDVTGSLLTGKIFESQTDTGRIRVPQSSGSGICRVYTDTGDIKLEVLG